MMVKFETFFCSFPQKATDELNKWIDEHPKVKILQFQYQQARMGDHSICIMYEEGKEE